MLALVCFTTACGDDDDDDADTSSSSSSSSGADTASSSSSGADTASSSSSGADTTVADTSSSGVDMMMMPPFGSPEDVAIAEGIWTEMSGEDFENAWNLFPGTTAMQVSGAPHAAFATILVNATAEGDLTAPADGSIIAKVNLDDDMGTIGAYTVMKKINGFDAEIDDWFWAKYAPDGTLMMNPDGVPLAGAVGSVGGGGCVGCHSGATGDDWIFVN